MKSVYIPIDPDRGIYRKYNLTEDVVDAIETLLTADEEGYTVSVVTISDVRGFNGTV